MAPKNSTTNRLLFAAPVLLIGGLLLSKSLTPMQAAQFKIAFSSRWEEAANPNHLLGVPHIDNFLSLILPFFIEAIDDPWGKILLTSFTGLLGTLIAFMLVEAARKGRPWYLGGPVVAIILTLGQLRGIGFMAPIFYIPLFALSGGHRPAPTKSAFSAAILSFFLIVTVSLATLNIPTTSPYWPLSNQIFQFFAILTLPLWVINPSSKAASSSSSSSKRTLKLFWTSLSLTNIFFNLYALYLLHSFLSSHSYTLSSLPSPSGATRFLLFDYIGTSITVLALTRLEDPEMRSWFRTDGGLIWWGLARLIGGAGWSLSECLVHDEDRRHRPAAEGHHGHHGKKH